MDNMDNIVKAFVDTLEGNIEAESTRSTACKTWTISMLTGFIVLCKATETTPNYLLMIAPITIFGLLDAYHLGTESWYRNIYKDFLDEATSGDCSSAFIINERTWCESIKHAGMKIISPSIWCFYPGLIVATVILFYILNYGK